MDRERRGIQREIALHNRSVVCHAQQITGAHLGEGHSKGVHPKVVSQFRISRRDMASYRFVETELAEQPEPAATICLRWIRSSATGRTVGLAIPRMIRSSPIPGSPHN